MSETIKPSEGPQQEMARFEMEIRELKNKLKPSSYLVLERKLVALKPDCGSAQALMDLLLEEYPDKSNPTRKELDIIFAGFFIEAVEAASIAANLIAANAGSMGAVEISERINPVKDDVDELLANDFGKGATETITGDGADPGRAYRARLDTIAGEKLDIYTRETTPPPGPLPVENDMPLSVRRKPLTANFGTVGAPAPGRDRLLTTPGPATYTDPDRMPTLHGIEAAVKTNRLIETMKSGVPIGEELEEPAENDTGIEADNDDDDEISERITQLDLTAESSPTPGSKKK